MVKYASGMSHVSTHLGEEELAYYKQRARDLHRNWGLDVKVARRQAYSEMLHRYLPQGHPVLRYYKA